MMQRVAFLVLAASAFWISVSVVHGDKPENTGKVTESQFEKEVWPLLQAKCLKCHSENKPKGGLRLDSREAVLKGGDAGPSAVLGKPSESLLIKVIDYSGDIQMPPSGKMADKEIALLRKWVEAGLPWKKGIGADPAKSAVVEHKPKRIEAKDYWAYQPLKRPAVPAVKNAPWVRNPIDSFVLASLESKGINPAPVSDRVSFIRRITYDLTGLPPTPKEVDHFVNDQSATAYERLVDRLLESRHYGEKWGRHWLDLVRFAETNGYERDGVKPFAWRYRDYVIRAFNNDKPFDRFIQEQLAGDELPGDDPDRIIATAYHRLGIWDDEPADPLQARFDEFDDLVATTGQVFLGMTMNCARCHDHKIDPISQKDYYGFVAFFADIPRFSDDRNPFSANCLTDITPMEKRKVYEAEIEARKKKIAELQNESRKIEDAGIARMGVEDRDAAAANDRPAVIKAQLAKHLKAEENKRYREIKKEIQKLESQKAPESQELALSVNHCNPRPEAIHVMIRGNAHSPGDKVDPVFPSAIADQAPVIPAPGVGAKTSGRRTALANWIASKENRLTARVFVNRLWQHHFGKGIVASTNDFGQFGEKPSHPELLDWLASEFMEGGWKIKSMHRAMLLSATYRQSARPDPTTLAQAEKSDPANNLLWKFPMRRLGAEEVRDSMLQVSGNLDKRMSGPGIYPPIPLEVLAGQSVPGQGWPTSPDWEANRRSVYVHVKRSLQLPILSQHDQADTDSSCPVRYTTVVPTQALGLLNSKFVQDQAVVFAKRLEKEAPGSIEEKVALAVRLTTGRQPTEKQLQVDLKLIEDLKKDHQMTAEMALRQFCLFILNTNEFFYLD